MSYKKKPKTIDPNEVDPSVYYYDEVYDEMKDRERSPERESGKSDKNKGSKYIQGLKESADYRKLERDLRKFKSYSRDRAEAEANHELDGEEVFITSSYKKKLEEMKKLEEEKRRQLEQEKDRSMNFLKKYDTSQSENKTTSKHLADDRLKAPETHSKESKEPSPETTSQKQKTERDTQRKPLRTHRERREYLRVILAKRTVGKLYEDAVQRYVERKALAQRS